jgi:hypothetical protein
MVTNQWIQIKESRRKLTSASKSYFLIGVPRQEVQCKYFNGSAITRDGFCVCISGPITVDKECYYFYFESFNWVIKRVYIPERAR